MERKLTVYLIRHGHIDDRRYGYEWKDDLSISGIGQYQAVLLGDSLAHEECFDKVFSSTYTRAMETAHIVCDRSGYPKDSIEYSDDLKEIPDKSDDKLNEWIENYLNERFLPGTNSMKIAVFSHGRAIKNLITHLVSDPRIEKSAIGNTSVTELCYSDCWTLKRIGDMSHIDQAWKQ